MSIENYRRVIQQWCAVTGMQPWEPDSDMHVDINDITVGLIYDSERCPDRLHVMADLGAFEFPDLATNMLKMNMLVNPEVSSYFALHPDTGNAVYRLDLSLTHETDGAMLPAQIASILTNAQEFLRS